jgi:hypothetical protein
LPPKFDHQYIIRSAKVGILDIGQMRLHGKAEAVFRQDFPQPERGRKKKPSEGLCEIRKDKLKENDKISIDGTHAAGFV